MAYTTPITHKLYNNAEQQQILKFEVPTHVREQLFRLKGYLEGVQAPKSMQEAYDELLKVGFSEHWIGPARFDV